MMTDQQYLNTPLANEGLLKRYFKSDQPLVIFDIGSCDGLDSVRYAKIFPQSKVFAFEPFEENVSRIKDNMKKYDITSVQIFQCALSNQNGEAEFYLSSGNPGIDNPEWDFGNKSSSLLPPAKTTEIFDWLKFHQKRWVETKTLADVMTQNNISIIDYIHMDVQGAEIMVLEGAKDLLSKIKVIWMEVERVELYMGQPVYEDIKRFMEKNRFTLVLDNVHYISGDQLWVNLSYFPYRMFTNKIICMLKSLRLHK